MLEILKEAPCYGGVCTFKNVYPSSVRLTRTHARSHKRNEKNKGKKEKGEKGNEQCVRT